MILKNNHILKFFIVTTLVAHVWATILAGVKEGFLFGFMTFFLPFVTEFFLCFMYWDEHPIFVAYITIHLLISGYYSLPKIRLM